MHKGVYLFALFVFFPLVSYAAFEFPSLGEPLIVKISPQTIHPESVVTLTAESFLIDLDRSTLVWLVNGKIIKDASNKNTLEVPVPKIGSETFVSLIVEDATGLRAEFETTLRPVELELLWESDSYTPPLYRGRALQSPGAKMIAHAEARFIKRGKARIPAYDIVYSWSLNGRVIENASGRGKSSFKTQTEGLFGDDVLSVEAVSLDGLFHATMSARIPSVEPLLVLYPHNPILGIDYGRAIVNRALLLGSESGVAALPYFSNSSGPRDRGLLYHWIIGGVEAALDSIAPFLLTLSIGNNQAGATTIEVVLENNHHVLQEVRRLWEIQLESFRREENIFTSTPLNK